MKEFNKWLNKECDEGRTVYLSSYNDCKDAWKAALKCVRDKMLSGCEECEPDMSVIYFIKEELAC